MRVDQKGLFKSRSLGKMSSLMANRIDTKFAELKQQGRAAFIAYIAAGDPTLDATRDLVLAMEKAGVDLMELGVPFSDPLADGVVNQQAAQRALDSGTTCTGVLRCVRRIREHSQIPIVLYTYMNPIYLYGFTKFHHDAAEAGVDGMLILDLPPDETEFAEEAGLKRIRLIAPTTPPNRICQLTATASGFIYYVSREGVTGQQSSVAEALDERVAAIRSTTDLPIAVGFGISDPEQAATVARVGDGVVVGSAIVKGIGDNGDSSELSSRIAAFVTPIADAIHSVQKSR